MILKRTEQYLSKSATNPRIIKIKELKKLGLSNAKIGAIFDISGERVRQIMLPPVMLNKYVFECSECQNIQTTASKNTPICLQCLTSKRIHNNKKLNVLNDIFRDLPEWKQQGREHTREIVRYRDDYTCQSCGFKWIKGTKSLDVHHLNGMCGKKSTGYDSIKDMANLITLCHKCHFNHPEHTLQAHKSKK